MPIQPTENQKNIFNRLKDYLNEGKGYPYLGYDGEADDSHRFGRPIKCYIKYISQNPNLNPPESLKVIIKSNERNENENGFFNGNDFYGPRSKHVFVIPNDEESYDRAIRLIDTI